MPERAGGLTWRRAKPCLLVLMHQYSFKPPEKYSWVRLHNVTLSEWKLPIISNLQCNVGELYVFVQAWIGFWNSIFVDLGHLRHTFLFPFWKTEIYCHFAVSPFRRFAVSPFRVLNTPKMNSSKFRPVSDSWSSSSVVEWIRNFLKRIYKQDRWAVCTMKQE